MDFSHDAPRHCVLTVIWAWGHLRERRMPGKERNNIWSVLHHCMLNKALAGFRFSVL